MNRDFNPEFYIHLQPHSALLVEKNSMYYFRLSGEAVEIALLLSKNKSLHKTAKVLSHLKKREVTEDELIKMLEGHPITNNWKTNVPNLNVTGSTTSYIPISSTLQLTNGCNLFCSFCYSSSGRRLKGELKAEEWISIMHRLATNGITDITLTGGEARLIKDFKNILSTASSLFTNVNLFSNGLNWNDDEIELIKNLGNVYVQVSVDGTPDIHDRLRGKKGSFMESIETVNRISQKGVPTLVAMTVNPENFHSVGEVIEYSVSANVSAFRAGITLPVGRAEDISFGLSPEEYKSTQTTLANAKKKYGDKLFLQVWDDNANEGCTEFSTPGYLQWYIRADGLVTPCQIESVSLGHILEDSFEELGNPLNLLAVQENAKTCKCISKVYFPEEKDLPHSYA